MKEEDMKLGDTSMESESADAAAAAAADDDDDINVGPIHEDKYARLIGLRATLDKCR